MPRFCDQYWSELPEFAKTAAGVLGYDQESWDADEAVPFDSKDFVDLTYNEKKAAHVLSIEFIEKKNDVWWEDVDEVTKGHAEALGWDEHKWDHDYQITDLECEHWYWSDMDSSQKEAAMYFGYCQETWDETGEEVTFDGSGSKPSRKPNRRKPQKSNKADEEKKDDDDDDGKAKAKKTFKESRFYGGGAGASFDHRNNRFVKEIELYTSSIVNGMKVTYHGGRVMKNGHDGPVPVVGRTHTMTMASDEYIHTIVVRAAGTIQELTFLTNKGQEFGPHGGKGRMMKDKEGEVTTVRAPNGYHLCGFFGRESKLIDALAFRWGPNSDVDA